MFPLTWKYKHPDIFINTRSVKNARRNWGPGAACWWVLCVLHKTARSFISPKICIKSNFELKKHFYVLLKKLRPSSRQIRTYSTVTKLSVNVDCGLGLSRIPHKKWICYWFPHRYCGNSSSLPNIYVLSQRNNICIHLYSVCAWHRKKNISND